MGSLSSKRNIVADKVSEDDSENYNLINLPAPTANLGVRIICGLVGVLGIYKLYRCGLRAAWCRPGGPMERKQPAQSYTKSVDMTDHTGHARTNPGIGVFRGGDGRDPFWQLKEDLCWTCLESSRLERPGGGRQGGVNGGHPPGERQGRSATSTSPARRMRTSSVLLVGTGAPIANQPLEYTQGGTTEAVHTPLTYLHQPSGESGQGG